MMKRVPERAHHQRARIAATREGQIKGVRLSGGPLPLLEQK